VFFRAGVPWDISWYHAKEKKKKEFQNKGGICNGPKRESSKIWKVSGKEKNRSQGPCTTKVIVRSLLHLMI